MLTDEFKASHQHRVQHCYCLDVIRVRKGGEKKSSALTTPLLKNKLSCQGQNASFLWEELQLLSSMVRLGSLMSSSVNLPQGKFRCTFAGEWNDSVFSVNHEKQWNYGCDLVGMLCFAGGCTAVTLLMLQRLVPPQQSPLLLEPPCRQLKQLFSLLLLSGTGDSFLSSLSGSLGSIKSVNLKQNKASVHIFALPLHVHFPVLSSFKLQLSERIKQCITQQSIEVIIQAIFFSLKPDSQSFLLLTD